MVRRQGGKNTKIRVAINGFGRIGRILARIILQNPHFKLMQVNDIYDTDMMYHLLKHDSSYGNFETDTKFKMTNHSDIKKLQWDNVDIVFECSGVYHTKKELSWHIKNGAKKVILSSFSKELPTYIYGINEKEYKNESIISNSSCTANCTVAVFKIIDKYLGIISAQITTIHSYTTDQNLLDNKNRDIRRSRSATQNIIPLSSNVANATVQFLPHLKGKITAESIRVPVINGVLIDINILLKKKTSLLEIKKIIRSHINPKISYFSNDHFVSSDIKKMPYSNIIDEELIKLSGKNLLKLMLWQDNEYGYARRILDMAEVVIRDS